MAERLNNESPKSTIYLCLHCKMFSFCILKDKISMLRTSKQYIQHFPNEQCIQMYKFG